MAPARIDPNDLLSSAQGIDLIGDIHGHLAPLERLLLELGYDRVSGIWRHSEGRKVLFLAGIPAAPVKALDPDGPFKTRMDMLGDPEGLNAFMENAYKDALKGNSTLGWLRSKVWPKAGD